VSSRRPSPRPSGNMAARGALVVIVAVLLGALILKNGFDSSASVNTGGGSTATTTSTAATTTTVAATTTTVNKASFIVLVANASGTSGAAGRLSEKMASDGFTMAEPVTATEKVDTTKVYYLSGYDAGANAVAAYLNVAPPEPIPEPKPVADLGQAQVLVLEGRDIASSAATPAATTTTAAPG